MAAAKSVDEYINRLEGTFAHPILSRMREIINETEPNIKEAIKWGSPSFEYNGLMMSLVAFKKNAAAWFHKGALLEDPHKLLEASSEETKAMRKYMISSLEELNVEGFKKLVADALEKQRSGEQVEGFNTRDSRYDHSQRLEDALKLNPTAHSTYKSLSDYKKREYIEHIESAKQEATRQRRLQKSIEMLEQGLGLHDKYRK